MANTLQVRYTGGTVSLQDAANGIDAEYTPLASERNADYTTDTIRLRVRKSTTAAVRTAMQEVERILDRARQFQSAGVGEPVYLDYKVSGYPDTYQSEIIDAYVTPQEGTTRTARVEGNAVKTMSFDVTLTRRNFWEGPQAWLPLSNANGTATYPTALRVFACNDGGTATYIRNNTIDIAGTDITGDLPAPVAFSFYFTSEAQSELYLFANSLETVRAPVQEAGWVSSGGTSITDATASDGSYVRKVTPYTANFGLEMSAGLAGLSQAYAVVLRMVGLPSADTKTILFTDNLNSLKTRWNYAATNSELQMIGTVFLPQPYLTLATTQAIGVGIERNTGGTIQIDFASLAGIDAGWAYVELRPTTRAAIAGMNTYFRISNVEGGRPMCTKPGYNYSTPVVGPGIHLMPGRNHRVVTLFADANGVWQRNTSCQVTAYYRPRRLAI